MTGMPTQLSEKIHPEGFSVDYYAYLKGLLEEGSLLNFQSGISFSLQTCSNEDKAIINQVSEPKQKYPMLKYEKIPEKFTVAMQLKKLPRGGDTQNMHIRGSKSNNFGSEYCDFYKQRPSRTLLEL